MTGPWACRLAPARVASLGPLRLVAGVRALEEDGAIWLRGETLSPAVDGLLRRIPGARRYRIGPDDRLVAPGERVPSDRLPDGEWTPLARWLTPELPPTTGVAALPDRAPVALRPAKSERPVRVLVLSLERFRTWVETAPAVRLEPLRFAATPGGRVACRGTPPPPLPGRRFAESEGVAVPCGRTWDPPVPAGVLADLLDLAPGDLALLAADGTVEVIPARSFVPAGRSAVRATAREASP